MKPPKSDESLILSYLIMRRVIGILGICLPVMVVLIGFLQNGLTFKGSISSYYFTNSRDIFVGILGTVALFLISYKGYDSTDNIITNLSGVFALGIIVFPTSMYLGTAVKVGTFLINDNISEYIHLTFSAMFFIALAYNSIFLFTKQGEGEPTKEKMKRNIIYVICGILILLSLICILIFFVFFENTSAAKWVPTLVFETVALIAFGFSWLVKGETLYRDK